MRLLNLWRTRRSRRTAADRTYAAIVAQARRQDFYTALGVPDTADGRFELICLHAALVMGRLRSLGPEGLALSETLFQRMFRDIDANLRELGVGDLAVPKRVKKMARAFNGRMAAYLRAVADRDDAALRDTLDRNLYGEAQVSPAVLGAMADYVLTQAAALAGLGAEVMVRGACVFAPIDGKGEAA